MLYFPQGKRRTARKEQAVLVNLHVKNLAIIDEVEVGLFGLFKCIDRGDRSRKVNYYRIDQSGSWTEEY